MIRTEEGNKEIGHANEKKDKVDDITDMKWENIKCEGKVKKQVTTDVHPPQFL